MTHYRLAVTLLIAATVLWGSTFSFTKVLVAAIPPMYLLAHRFLLASFLVFLICPRTIISEFPRGIRDKHLLIFSLVSIGAIGLQTYGIQFTTASNAGFITAFSVVLVPILKRLHYKTGLSRQIYLAITVALSGLYMISFGLTIPQSMNRGDFLVFLCALLYGYYIVILEIVVRTFSGATAMFFSFGLTSIVCFILGALLETHPTVGTMLSGSVMLNLLALVVLGSVAAYLLMAWGQKHVKAEIAGLIYALEPIFALIIAWIFLRESLTPWQMVGAGLVMLALIVGIRHSQVELQTRRDP